MVFGLQDEAEVNILALLKAKDTPEADKRGALVEEILHRHRIVTIEETGAMLWYNAGVYVPGAEQKIQAELQTLAGFEITNHMRAEVIATVKAMTYKPRAAFDSNPNILNLRNGLLNIETGEFRPFMGTSFECTTANLL